MNQGLINTIDKRAKDVIEREEKLEKLQNQKPTKKKNKTRGRSGTKNTERQKSNAEEVKRRERVNEFINKNTLMRRTEIKRKEVEM